MVMLIVADLLTVIVVPLGRCHKELSDDYTARSSRGMTLRNKGRVIVRTSGTTVQTPPTFYMGVVILIIVLIIAVIGAVKKLK